MVMKEIETLSKCWKEKTLPPMAEVGTWQAKYCRWHAQCKRYEKEPDTAPPLADKRP